MFGAGSKLLRLVFTIPNRLLTPRSVVFYSVRVRMLMPTCFLKAQSSANSISSSSSSVIPDKIRRVCGIRRSARVFDVPIA